MKFEALRAAAEPVALDHPLLMALIAARAAATPTARAQAKAEPTGSPASFAPHRQALRGKQPGNLDASADRQPNPPDRVACPDTPTDLPADPRDPS